MTKNGTADNFYNEKPRKIDKKKHHGKGFTEEALDTRVHRINFKSYVQQVREEELSTITEEWVVERGVMFGEEVQWSEIESFESSNDAEDSAEDHRETDTYGDQYRVRRV